MALIYDVNNAYLGVEPLGTSGSTKYEQKDVIVIPSAAPALGFSVTNGGKYKKAPTIRFEAKNNPVNSSYPNKIIATADASLDGSGSINPTAANFTVVDGKDWDKYDKIETVIAATSEDDAALAKPAYVRVAVDEETGKITEIFKWNPSKKEWQTGPDKLKVDEVGYGYTSLPKVEIKTLGKDPAEDAVLLTTINDKGQLTIEVLKAGRGYETNNTKTPAAGSVGIKASATFNSGAEEKNLIINIMDTYVEVYNR